MYNSNVRKLFALLDANGFNSHFFLCLLIANIKQKKQDNERMNQRTNQRLNDCMYHRREEKKSNKNDYRQC